MGERESDNRTGDLDIKRDVTIAGAGVGATIFDGVAADRLLDIFAPASVRVTGLTLQNGRPGAGRRGGAIVVLDGASLVLRDILVTDNETWDGPDRIPDGGGIYNDGTLRIVDSTVRDNLAGGLEGSGGGIWSSGKLTLIDSTVSGNRAAGSDPRSHAIDGGGGIYSEGRLEIRGSTISGNQSAYRGGGVASRRRLIVVDSRISGNTSASSGGGILNVGGTVDLEATLVLGNVAGRPGGGIRNSGGGAITLDASSSVQNNSSDNCFGTAAC